jgi:hypothetical protein
MGSIRADPEKCALAWIRAAVAGITEGARAARTGPGSRGTPSPSARSVRPRSRRHGRSRSLIAGIVTRGGICLLRAARAGPTSPGIQLLKPLGQVIESVNDTFKGQFDLERHGGRLEC